VNAPYITTVPEQVVLPEWFLLQETEEFRYEAVEIMTGTRLRQLELHHGVKIVPTDQYVMLTGIRDRK